MSTLASISIRRPVLAIVMSLTIMLFGLIGYFNLGVREYPSVDPAIVTVSTNYTGANAEVIESQITEPLEASLNSVEGIKTLTSVSREGRSTITVEFDLDVDLERAANDVRDRAARAVGVLPPDADPPIIAKADADNSPIVFLNISSEQRDLLELSEIAQNVFKERLQTIPGVSAVNIWGEKRWAMRLWMYPHRLAAYGMTPLDVRAALARQNVELPSGRLEGNNVELTVRTMGRISEPDEFENLILRQEGDQVVRFKDVGFAMLGAANERTILKRDGVPMVGVVLLPQPGANHIDIVDEFHQRVDQIKVDLPADIDLAVGFDNTLYIRKSIREVQQTILIAIALVILIIFLFLRDWRTTLIPVLVIPVALTGSFFIMYAAGFSINVLTLLGVVLAIGLVVDDAIVVLENIYAKIEAGMPPLQAGIVGTREIFFAVIATTLALASVFLPILFFTGLTGRLFREFGFVIAGCVIISSFVALTLTPMLSTRLLGGKRKHSRFYLRTEPFFVRVNQAYSRSLGTFLRRRWLAFPVLAGSAFLAVFLFSILPSELAPYEDRSRLMVFASGPEGTTYEYMDAYMDRLVAVTRESIPETEAVVSVTSPGFSAAGSVNSGFSVLILKDRKDRERSQQEISDDFLRRVRSLTGARTNVSQPPTIGGGGFAGMPVQYVLQAQNMDKLREALPQFLAAAQQDPTFAFVDADLKFNKPELQVRIDRERASSLGLSVLDLSQTMQMALSGLRYGYFIKDGKQYDVIGQLAREYRSEPLSLTSLFVRTPSGQPVALGNLVDLVEETSPPQLFRYNRFTSATVSAALAPGRTIGDGIAAMDRIAAEVLDESFATALRGASRDYAESASSLMFVFILALIMIYLVLASQFESFRDPVTILLTVPLALTGALFSLWYFNQTVNVFSQIGMIMLIGLVTKNGILIVEFANQRRTAGLPIQQAIHEAATARFRPILMTSLSTILGILPIALSLGAGSESRMPMGIAVIGGLLVGSLFSLYIIPAMYTFITSRTLSPALSGDGAGVETAVPVEAVRVE